MRCSFLWAFPQENKQSLKRRHRLACNYRMNNGGMTCGTATFPAPVPASFEEWMSFALPNGEDSAMRQYNSYTADPRHRYPGNLQEKLDALGRRLLEQHHDEWALAAFQVNVKLHPDAGGLFFSLGDGYAALYRNEKRSGPTAAVLN